MAKFVDCRMGILSRGAALARTHYQRSTIGRALLSSTRVACEDRGVRRS